MTTNVIVKRVFSVEGALGVFVYLALGLAVYMGFGEFAVFSWAAPMLFVYMALWPIILLIEFLKWVFIIGLIIGVGFLIWALADGRGRSARRRHR